MEMINKKFWKNKKVFVTGHTGFKGSWLCLLLQFLEAKVVGYALDPPTDPNLYNLCKIDDFVVSNISDIRDKESFGKCLNNAAPDIVIHMAAQPLVRESYLKPVETYATNVMGTAHLLEAVRQSSTVGAVVVVTTDKCYDNKEWVWGYRENEPLGGFDPYSSSKACAEIVTAAYRNSFFSENKIGIATARAGNVIGGGDWAADRLIPDCINALLNSEKIILRNPYAIRPWQHVLEPLNGYLLLAQNLYENRKEFSEAWNFGPRENDCQTVEEVVKILCQKWNESNNYSFDKNGHPHEAQFLKLDWSKAHGRLNWQPHWNIYQTIEKIVEWMKVYSKGEDINDICNKQIKDYFQA